MVVLEDGVVVREELVVRGLEEIEVSLELLGFPTSAAVLKPDGDLPGLKTKLVGKLSLALWLQLVLLLEALLQQMHLFMSKATLFVGCVIVVVVDVDVVVEEIIGGAKEGSSL